MRREQILLAIKRTLKKHRIKKAYLFGSFARGEKNYQDIDIAITPPRNFSLMDMAGILVEIEETTAKKVDLISTRAIHPRIAPRIRKDMVAIL